MADRDDIPPVPVPPAGSAVPPVEPQPAAPQPVATPAPQPPAPAEPSNPPLGAPVPPPAAPPAPAPPAAPGSAAAPASPSSAAPSAAAYGRPNPYAAPTGGYAAYSPAPAGPPQGLSITSMILGIVGLLFTLVGFGFLPAVAAVITGHLGQRRQPYARPFWLTGMITGYIGVAFALLTGLVLLMGFLVFLPLAYVGN